MAEPVNFINELPEKFKFKIMLFIYFYTLFNGSVSNSNYILLDETEWWLKKGYGRKMSKPNSRIHPGICLKGIKKTTKTFIRIDGVPYKNWTRQSKILVTIDTDWPSFLGQKSCWCGQTYDNFMGNMQKLQTRYKHISKTP